MLPTHSLFQKLKRVERHSAITPSDLESEYLVLTVLDRHSIVLHAGHFENALAITKRKI